MSSEADPRMAARTRAQSHFAAAEQRDATVFAEIARERAAMESKIAKLRAQRLAREEVERAEQARAAAENPDKPARRRKTTRKAVRVPVG